MKVERIRTGNGSHIEPPLDEAWPDLDKLRWHLSVALHDARLPDDIASIGLGNLTVNGCPVPHAYEIRWRSLAGRTNGSWGTTGFRTTWALINGIGLGFGLAHGEAQ